MLRILKNLKLLSRCADYLTRQIETRMPLVPAETVGTCTTGDFDTHHHTHTGNYLHRSHKATTSPSESSKGNRTSSGDFSIVVCGEEEVPKYHEAGITEILTCISPERPVFRPSWPTLRDHLIVRCDDVEEPIEDYVCPNEEHVRQIVQFGQKAIQRYHRGDNVRLLVHCAAGISRSTAATLLILSMKLGKGAEADAMRYLTSIRPICRPNAVIVGYGDRLLGREGRLIHQVALWKTRHHAALVAG